MLTLTGTVSNCPTATVVTNPYIRHATSHRPVLRVVQYRPIDHIIRLGLYQCFLEAKVMTEFTGLELTPNLNRLVVDYLPVTIRTNRITRLE